VNLVLQVAAPVAFFALVGLWLGWLGAGIIAGRAFAHWLYRIDLRA
jgi:hypothetical protein